MVKPPDVIVALSGGITPSDKAVSQTGSYADTNETGVVVPGMTRVVATSAIAQAIPDVPIITNRTVRSQTGHPWHL